MATPTHAKTGFNPPLPIALVAELLPGVEDDPPVAAEFVPVALAGLVETRLGTNVPVAGSWAMQVAIDELTPAADRGAAALTVVLPLKLRDEGKRKR